MSNPEYFVAIDWGTSCLRSYLCKVLSDGSIVLMQKSFGLGVNKISNTFEQTLLVNISNWERQYGKFPIFMSGQIGSSIGWKETKYISCPVSPNEVIKNCKTFVSADHLVRVIPGVSCYLSNNNHEVMRGEELQILGWLLSNPDFKKEKHLICLPGTHTKWVLVEHGKIILFKTAMTGELYDLLVHHSVLIQDEGTEFDHAAFIQGAKFTLKSELGSFTHGLFSVRSKQIFGELSSNQANSYLSGILIGSDVRAAIHTKDWDINNFDKIHIIGSSHLSNCFSTVLNIQGVKTEVCDLTEMTLLGFYEAYNYSISLEK